jgi:hypothetical protein
MRPELKYIGSKVTIKALRDFILDSEITENDTILLNPINHDDIVLEYREIYSESINLPYILLGVLIEEDKNNQVPENRIGLIQHTNNIE